MTVRKKGDPEVDANPQGGAGDETAAAAAAAASEVGAIFKCGLLLAAHDGPFLACLASTMRAFAAVLGSSSESRQRRQWASMRRQRSASTST